MRLQENVGGRLDPRPVLLQPFGHQVAGQGSMLSLDATTVCKPLIAREHHLYCTLPSSLQPFTPHYYGVLYVRLEEGEEGSYSLWGYYPESDHDQAMPRIHIKGHLHRDDRQDNMKPGHHSKPISAKQNTTDNDSADNTSHTVDNMPRGSQNNTVDGNLVFRESEQARVDISQVVRASQDNALNNSEVVRQSHHNDKTEVSIRPQSREQTQDMDHQRIHQDVPTLKESTPLMPHDKVKHEGNSDLVEGSDGDLNVCSYVMKHFHREEEGIEEIEEDERCPVSLVSGLSSGASTPISSGSELDVPSATDTLHSSCPSKHPPRLVVPLKLDSETDGKTNSSNDNTPFTSTGGESGPQVNDESIPSNVPTTPPLNPWGLSLHTRLLDKMRKSRPSPSGCPFIVLENVVGHFVRPCILDLKVGSRLHGDDASEKKITSQSHKCNMTTSRTLGLRLCGMQVYQVTTGTYKSLDKYQGRTLTDKTFRDVLCDFLHNGRVLRWELLAPILTRLHALLDCLQGLNSFRFYASSLLIMYDGLHSDYVLRQGTSRDASQPRQLTFRDAHVLNSEKNVGGVCVSELDGTNKEAGGYVQQTSSVQGRRDNEQDTRSVHEEKSNKCDPSPSQSQWRGMSCTTTAVTSATSTHTLVQDNTSLDMDCDGTSSLKDDGNIVSSRQLVDVRMIDFAHTTHSGFQDKIMHEGPDRDYMWGLQNLTHLFSQIQQDNC